MEAEDTVMTKEEINKVAFTNPLLVAQKQAKISFKAGQREVVEWIKEHKESGTQWEARPYEEQGITSTLRIPHPALILNREEWRAKLKEWERGE